MLRRSPIRLPDASPRLSIRKMTTPTSATPSPIQPERGVRSPISARMIIVNSGTIATSSADEKGEVWLSPITKHNW